MSRDGGFEEGELDDEEIAALLPDWTPEDSESLPDDESSRDKATRWLDELVVNVKLTDDQVIEVAKVYAIHDLIDALTQFLPPR